ncbi:DUF3667 domain-containing protein [Lutibacter citreus]|uniref:DUF3667 domain-containing protein n=1 Tax=Lutibacter citreus TaxID=2138210 RepID=UPI0013001D5E|nr:DUF3667 domain-containing protein [Lutibacter citreus]
MLEEISNSIFQVNRGILFTIKELFTRPGKSIREYLEGKRKKHFKPLAFVLLASTLYVLTTYLTDMNTYLGDSMFGIAESLSKNTTDASASVKFLNWLANNNAYSTLLFLPIFSLASYLVFKKSKYNYFEHLILNFYITGQQTVIYLIFSLVFFKGYYMPSFPFILGIIFNFWVFNQFFKNNKTIKNMLLILLTYILFHIELIILISIITGVVIFNK